jgi:putative endonuclease
MAARRDVAKAALSRHTPSLTCAPRARTVGAMTPDPRRHLGDLGERLACEHLERRGYRIVERNYRTRWGEIDVIAADRATLVFCEVKTRRRGGGAPWEALGVGKQRQVRRIAGRWLTERSDRPRAVELRFDAIGVTIDPRGRLVALDHLEGAF